jgi:carboxynorspermidine decarboxylase
VTANGKLSMFLLSMPAKIDIDMAVDIQKLEIRTPSFLYDGGIFKRSAEAVVSAAKSAGCGLIYSMKPLTLYPMLQEIVYYVEGFSVSSVFEARLAKKVITPEQTIHFASPRLVENEIAELVETCDYINLNSLSQWKRFRDSFAGKVQCGLRINPELSFVADEKHDPCRSFSKLGTPLETVKKALKDEPGIFDGIDGVHIHSNSEADNFAQFRRTIEKIENHIPELLERCKWIDLGGGYLFEEPKNLEDFNTSINRLKTDYGLDAFIEPGLTFVNRAGSLITSVIDMFDQNGKTVVVVDATVNHLPEVLEFEYEPDIAGYTKTGEYEYLITGCSCLAGDIFGEYRFMESLGFGSRLQIENIGAYSLVKAHRFNGINLPDVWYLAENGELELLKRFTFEEYASCNGVI